MTDKDSDVKAGQGAQQADASSGQERAVQRESGEAPAPSAVKDDVKTLADGSSEDKPVPYSRLKEVLSERDKLKSELDELQGRKRDMQSDSDVSESLIDELLGISKKKQQLAQADDGSVPRGQGDPPDTTPVRPTMTPEAQAEDLDRPITRRELMQMESQRQHYETVREIRAQFDSGMREGIAYLCKNHEELTPERAELLLDGAARRAMLEKHIPPQETARFISERLLKPLSTTILKKYVEVKKADREKPSVDSGGGAPTVKREIKSFGDAKRSFMERLKKGGYAEE